MTKWFGKRRPKRRERPYRSNFTARTVLLLLGTTLLLGFVFVRVAYIKAVQGEEYQYLAEQQQLNSTNVTIPSLRGSIRDRNGNVLAESVRIYNVILDCQMLIDADNSEQNSTVLQLMHTLKLESEDQIRKYMTDEYHEYRYLKLNEGLGISAAQMEEIQAGIDDGAVIGVWFEEDERRTYLNNSLAAHVLGFNGVYGVEQYYDDYLKGVDGRKMIVAGDGNTFVEEYIPAENGNNLTLTIDMKVQYEMEQVLQNAVMKTEANRGIAIAMNCKTGELIGLAMCPTYNLNNVQELIGVTERWKQNHPDTNDPNYYAEVWNNYAISMTYEPGSTFKPIFTAAALNEGVITDKTVFVCGGEYVIYDAAVYCHNGAVHGTESIREVLINSCNIGMAQVASYLPTEKWLQYQEAYGLAQLTGIDMAGEAGDSRYLVYVSQEEAARNGMSNGMWPFERATTSFGQGFTLTPIQMVCAFSSMINGGEYLKPYVVSQITDENGNIVETHSKEVLRYTVAEEVSKMIRPYLRDLVDQSTGQLAQLPGYSIGGKTGTAEKIDETGQYIEDAYIVSFISFAPADDPEIVLLVVLDEPMQQSSAPAIVTNGQILEKILPALGHFPNPSINPDAVWPSGYDLANLPRQYVATQNFDEPETSEGE